MAQRDLKSEGLRRVRLAEWAREQGIARITAYRMLQRGILPVPTERSPTGRWYVLVPERHSQRLAFYTRATPSPDQALVINDQIATLSEWATTRRQRVYIVVKELATPFADNMPKLAMLLADQQISEIVVTTPTVLGESLFQLLVAALAPQGRAITAAGHDLRRAPARTGDLPRRNTEPVQTAAWPGARTGRGATRVGTPGLKRRTMSRHHPRGGP